MKNNEQEHKEKIQRFAVTSEKRTNAFKSIHSSNLDKINEEQKSQFDELNKLHHYRQLIRNRETKNTSLYNKRSVQDRHSPKLNIDKLEHYDSTGLVWDQTIHTQTILKKGKLTEEGIKILKMDDIQKQKEMNFVLRDMIKQKTIRKQMEKEVEEKEYELMMQEL